MKPVIAIARIALRNAVRSKVVLVLLALLLVASVVLPLTVEGDGTIAGAIQILLSYTLGAVMIILSIATVWAGCAAVSQDVGLRHIHLILTKPVSRTQVWMGKWIGLLILNAVLLAIAAFVVLGILYWNMHGDRLTADDQETLHEEILVARRVVLPEPASIDDLVEQTFQERQSRGALPAAMPTDQVYQAIRDAVHQRLYTVPTGQKTEWEFRVPRGYANDQPLSLRYQFSSSLVGDVAVTGLWLIERADGSPPHQIAVTNVAEGEHTVTIPARLAKPGSLLRVGFANVNRIPVTVLFHPADGIQLLVHQGGFLGNYLRSLVVMFCQLAFLAALAVSAGSLFSLPTAALVTGYVLLLTQIGDYLQTLATKSGLAPAPLAGSAATEPAFSVVDVLVRIVAGFQNLIVQPLRGVDPLAHLPVGELIGWDAVALSILIKVVLYSGALAAATSWLFNRRELGVAE